MDVRVFIHPTIMSIMIIFDVVVNMYVECMVVLVMCESVVLACAIWPSIIVIVVVMNIVIIVNAIMVVHVL